MEQQPSNASTITNPSSDASFSPEGFNTARSSFSLDRTHESEGMILSNEDSETQPADILRELSQSLYDGNCSSVSHQKAAAWIGDAVEERSQVRKAYMSLFDWTGQSVLTAVRSLCDRLYLKAESQQLDRIVEAFSERWCECNQSHGFKLPSVVYTLAYSILLLNTDLHSKEYSANRKIPRSQYVQSTLDAMRILALEGQLEFTGAPSSKDARSAPLKKRWTPGSNIENTALVCDTNYYVLKEWEFIATAILKSIYASVDMSPLNLAGGDSQEKLSSHIESVRCGSWVSSTENWTDYEYSDAIANSSNARNYGRRRSVFTFDSNTKPNANNANAHSASKSTSQDHNVGFAGVLWSTIIREQLEKAQMTGDDSTLYAEPNASKCSIESYIPLDTIGVHDPSTVEVNSIFSGSSIESQTFRGSTLGILEVAVGAPSDISNNSLSTDMQREEQLLLNGAPWAKEGLLKFQAFFEKDSTPKKYKKKGWTEVFVVVERGYLKMFQFDKQSGSKKKLSVLSNGKAKTMQTAQGEEEFMELVGSGNWMDNATMVDDVSLCHTMAQIICIASDGVDLLGNLPGSGKPGKKPSSAAHSGNNVQWSLRLPNGGVLAFLAGTREIADEYVYTCNYWAARVSREPLVEAVSSSEFGWDKPLKLVFRQSIKSSNTSAHSRPGSTSNNLSTSLTGSSATSAVIKSTSAFARTLLKKPNQSAATYILSREDGSAYKTTSASIASAAATEAAISLLKVSLSCLTTAALSNNKSSVFGRVTTQAAEGCTVLVNNGKKYFIASGSSDVLFINDIMIQIKEWRSPVHSQVHSMLDELNQIASLRKYSKSVDETLEDHTGRRAQMMSIYTSNAMVTRQVNANWEKRSNYLLGEAVKCDIYVMTLQRAVDDRCKMEM